MVGFINFFSVQSSLLFVLLINCFLLFYAEIKASNIDFDSLLATTTDLILLIYKLLSLGLTATSTLDPGIIILFTSSSERVVMSLVYD